MSIAVMIALYAAGAPPLPSPQPRKAYGACLQKTVKAKVDAKLARADLMTELHNACAAEEAAFVKSIADYDVAMGSKRAVAEAGAREQVEDYLQNAADNYESATTPAKPGG
jgi:hypothetical protein